MRKTTFICDICDKSMEGEDLTREQGVYLIKVFKTNTYEELCYHCNNEIMEVIKKLKTKNQ